MVGGLQAEHQPLGWFLSTWEVVSGGIKFSIVGREFILLDPITAHSHSSRSASCRGTLHCHAFWPEAMNRRFTRAVNSSLDQRPSTSHCLVVTRNLDAGGKNRRYWSDHSALEEF